MNKIIDIMKSNKKKFYIIIAFIILIVIIFIFNIVNTSKNKNKEISNKDYVFTQVENNNKQMLPYINIKGDKIDIINDKISTEYFNIVLNDKNTFTYNYYIEDNILYIFITIEKYNENNIMNPKYIAYYINVDDGTIYNIKDILKKHKIDYNSIESKITKIINSSYVEETELGYVEKGFCDFECYLDIHDISSLNKNMMLSYDGINFKIYLNYTVETIYYVEDNPVEFPHEFEL